MRRSLLPILVLVSLPTFSGCSTTSIRPPAPKPPPEALVPCAIPNVDPPAAVVGWPLELQAAYVAGAFLEVVDALRVCRERHSALVTYAEEVSK